MNGFLDENRNPPLIAEDYLSRDDIIAYRDKFQGFIDEMKRTGDYPRCRLCQEIPYDWYGRVNACNDILRDGT